MSDQVEQPMETETSERPGELTDGLERVWSEIKQISKQVELETRRSGRIARLRLDLRRLRREVEEVNARLGAAVYEARNISGEDTPLADVEGFAGGVAGLDALHAQIRAKEEEIDSLRQQSAEPTGQEPIGPDEVAQEPASG